MAKEPIRHANNVEQMVDLQLKGWRFVQVIATDGEDDDKWLVVKKHRTKAEADRSKKLSKDFRRVVLSVDQLASIGKED